MTRRRNDLIHRVMIRDGFDTDLSLEDLAELTVRAHAARGDFMSDGNEEEIVAKWRSCPLTVRRLWAIKNALRHVATNYEDVLEEIRRTDRDNNAAYRDIKKRANSLVDRAFPHLDEKLAELERMYKQTQK